LLDFLPNDADLLNFFGMLRNQQGFAEEGGEGIRMTLQAAPDYIDPENSLSNIHMRIGQAEGCFDRTIKLNPRLALACANFGIALKELG
jgi:Tfp pilus assembly protein PilF